MVPFIEMGIPERGAGLREKTMNMVWDIHLAIIYGKWRAWGPGNHVIRREFQVSESGNQSQISQRW